MKKRVAAVALAVLVLLPAGEAYADDTAVTPFGWKGRESATTYHDPSLTVEDKVTMSQP
ncbi:MAG TPA: hypothetical protein VFC19_35010 [Candidatus Limnocylindrales bacterium]|nr:hypothetical protein [Candidatus Limnocylindrales bacterium]